MDAIKLIQWKLECERANARVEGKESINSELRKKDLYTIEYTVPAFIASPADKYVERKGPFEHEIDCLSRKMDEIVLEQGKPIEEKLSPFMNEGEIGLLHWNKSYRILNCLLEQDVRSANAHIPSSIHQYQLLYTLSVMGRERPVNNLVEILHDEHFSPDPFHNKVINPVIRRYENISDLRPDYFNSISELVKKLKLVATMGYIGNKKTDWKWIEDKSGEANE